MNHDILKGEWKQFRGHVRAKWGKLTDNDVDLIAGKKEMLVGKLQERYGRSKDEAEREVDAFYHDLDADPQREQRDARHTPRS